MKELFYQGEYLLNKKGFLTLMTNQKSIKIVEEEAKNYKFKVVEKQEIKIGTENQLFVKFKQK